MPRSQGSKERKTAPRNPTLEEMGNLTAFLPLLYQEGAAAVVRWRGETKRTDGAVTLPWPDYSAVVKEFFGGGSGKCWTDPDYLSSGAQELLLDARKVAGVTLEQVRSMLTFCCRGERFCDGHWAAMLEQGHVCRLLERVAELRIAAAKGAAQRRGP
jgi:hypothetical protein